ncbi:unnamed protein product [Orchesella dallaii]|uniref:DUF243 domain-containing protein n=1 Tax=Orchesella dallaii TaxID=48710 RepID=A0ABP1RI30_9HEXA
MRTLLLLAASLGVAYAGVGQLSPSEEADALSLFNRLCNGRGSEGQDIGGTLVYCKRGPGEISESQNHRVRVPGSQGKAQAVFVQPPPARYHHNVDIVSEGGEGGRTKIYVLPQQATHTVTPNILPQPGTQTKPIVYFLGGNGGGRSGGGGGGSSGSSGFNSNSLGGSYGAPEIIQSVRNGYN